MNPVCKCGKQAELYNPNPGDSVRPGPGDPEHIWLCQGGCGVVQRNNIMCPDCQVETKVNKFDAQCSDRTWICPRCTKIVYQVNVQGSDYQKNINNNKTINLVPAHGLNKSKTPCQHGSNCWSVSRGKCPYMHSNK